MITDFDEYISSLPKLEEDDLYLDIDETMKLRESEKPEVKMTKGYALKRK